MDQDSLEFLLRSSDHVELLEGPQLRIDLRYATPNNFMGRNVYQSFNRAFLHRHAFNQLQLVLEHLVRESPGYKLIIYDATRPRALQEVLWQHVVGTPNQMYVADPAKRSLHNYGLAIDLSILDRHGRELDMGAGFDDFREVAQPRHEARLLRDGQLTNEHIQNRDHLRAVMAAGGFAQLAHEWWHFNAVTLEVAKANFPIVY